MPLYGAILDTCEFTLYIKITIFIGRHGEICPNDQDGNNNKYIYTEYVTVCRH